MVDDEFVAAATGEPEEKKPEPAMRVPPKGGRGPKPFNPDAPPVGYQVRLLPDEWAIIHGPNPLSIYETRGGWRPIPPRPGMTIDTPNGPFAAVVETKGPCARCGARRDEVFSPEGAVRCFGCGVQH